MKDLLTNDADCKSVLRIPLRRLLVPFRLLQGFVAHIGWFGQTV